MGYYVCILSITTHMVGVGALNNIEVTEIYMYICVVMYFTLLLYLDATIHFCVSRVRLCVNCV